MRRSIDEKEIDWSSLVMHWPHLPKSIPSVCDCGNNIGRENWGHLFCLPVNAASRCRLINLCSPHLNPTIRLVMNGMSAFQILFGSIIMRFFWTDVPVFSTKDHIDS